MSDILERAEALCGDTYRYEETTEDTDGTLRNLVDRANILPELIAECKRQQAEAARWQAVATEERCKVIMLIEKLKDVANHADWQTRGLSKTHDEYIKQAAEELQAAAALGCKPRAWLMNEERKTAIQSVMSHAVDGTLWKSNDDYLRDINVIRAMLEEAKQ